MKKLRSLINITEQAPMPPMGGAPIPAQTPPSQRALPQEEPPMEEPTPEPEVDNNPQPEDPSEYDWTRDFRSFEDAKNKAESAAKKKLLDKMNKMLLGKKVTVNASRGYGQPKTDYTVESIKKISVEFWYKEWVIIVIDDKDKKYFLTPGVNIKIEGGSEGPASEEVPQAPETSPENQPQSDLGQEEQPNVQQPQADTEQPADQAPQQEPAVDSQTGVPAPEQQPQFLKKKKKAPLVPVAENVDLSVKFLAERVKVKKDLNLFLSEFMAEHVKNENGQVEFDSYIKKIVSTLNENKSRMTIKSSIQIPINDMVSPLDIREIKLEAKNAIWSSGNRGDRFSNASIDIDKIGRFYIINFIKESGWKS